MNLSDYEAPESPEPVEHQSTEPEEASLDPDRTLFADELGVDETFKQKYRKPLAKLNATRLLGEKGLPLLQKRARRLRLSTKKGHKSKILWKVLAMYQLWGHVCFPKANLDDFIYLSRRAGRDRQVRDFRKRVIEEEKYGSLAHDVLETSEERERDGDREVVDTQPQENVGEDTTGSENGSVLPNLDEADWDHFPGVDEHILNQSPPSASLTVPQAINDEQVLQAEWDNDMAVMDL